MATGPYGGDVLFVLTKDSSFAEGVPDDMGYHGMSTPAPVQWVSQFPHEEEFLWCGACQCACHVVRHVLTRRAADLYLRFLMLQAYAHRAHPKTTWPTQCS